MVIMKMMVFLLAVNLVTSSFALPTVPTWIALENAVSLQDTLEIIMSAKGLSHTSNQTLLVTVAIP